MESIGVSKLRAHLMKVLKEVEQGEKITITNRGKVVATLVPPDFTREKARDKLKQIQKDVVLGDVVSPIDTSWKAETE